MNFLATGTQLKRREFETNEDFAARLTQFSVNLTAIVNATCLFLYDNNLSQILLPSKITRLHLQNNNLSSFDGINGLVSLEFLNLSRNNIVHVLFSDLPNLKTLNLDSQKSKGLVFDRETCVNSKLEILTLTDNGIANVTNLSYLKSLQSLNLSSNEIACSSGILPIVSNEALTDINLSGNPIKKDRKLRQLLILSSPSLLSINEKAVTTFEREFTFSMNARKPKPKQTEAESAYLPITAVPHLPPYASQYRDLLLQQMTLAAAKAPEFSTHADSKIDEEI